MRYGLLAVIIAVACLLAVFRPKIGLLFYIWFAIVRPDTLAWASSSGFSMVLAVVTLVGALRYLPRVIHMLVNPWVVALLMLWLLCLMSAVLAVQPDLSYPPFLKYSRMITMALLIPLVLTNIEDVKWCLWVIGGSLGFIGVKLGLYGLIHGGVRYAGGYGIGFLGDNNTVALAMVMGLPICWYAIGTVKPLWAKLMFGSMSFLLLVAIVMCHSRGGVLAMAFVGLLLAFRSKRKVLTAAAIVVLALPVVWLVRETFLKRMATLANYEEDASAYNRLVFARAAVKMWADHPFTGVGFGTVNERRLLKSYVQEANDPEMVIHNTYLQMLADSGIFAFAVFMLLLFGGLVWLERSIRRTRRTRAPDTAIPLSLQNALLGCSVGCMFLSRVDFDLTYILLMTMAAWHIVSRQPVPVTVAPAPEPVEHRRQPAGLARPVAGERR